MLRDARTTLRLLDLDPELDEVLPASTRLRLRDLVVRVEHVDRGPWTPGPQLATRARLGVLVVDGLLIRRLAVGTRSAGELIGAGDIIRPWEDNDHIPAFAKASWRVIEHCSLALLDDRILDLGRSSAALIEALIARSVRRSRILNFQQIVASSPRAEQRLLMIFAVLASRWGRVHPDGVHVSVRLNQRDLAEIIGARRPTVTAALGGLSKQGRVSRTPDGWIVALDVVNEVVTAPAIDTPTTTATTTL